MEESLSGLLPMRALHADKTVCCGMCFKPMAGILEGYLRSVCEPCGGYPNTYWQDQMKREALEKRQFRKQRGIP